jgi:hypothetical protein
MMLETTEDVLHKYLKTNKNFSHQMVCKSNNYLQYKTSNLKEIIEFKQLASFI